MRPERRQFPRYPFVAYVEVSESKWPNQSLKARTTDLSRQGIFIDTATPFAVGTVVKLIILKNEKRFAAVATVVHASAYNGMGMSFLSIRPEHLATLERWLLELSGEVPEDVPTGPEDHADRKQFLAELRTVLDRVLTDSEKGVAKRLFSNEGRPK